MEVITQRYEASCAQCMQRRKRIVCVCLCCVSVRKSFASIRFWAMRPSCSPSELPTKSTKTTAGIQMENNVSLLCVFYVKYTFLLHVSRHKWCCSNSTDLSTCSVDLAVANIFETLITPSNKTMLPHKTDLNAIKAIVKMLLVLSFFYYDYLKNKIPKSQVNSIEKSNAFQETRCTDESYESFSSWPSVDSM